MEALLLTLKELITSLAGKVKGNDASHFQLIIFTFLTAVLWCMIGGMSGGVLAFFVLLFTPDGPGRGYPAYYCFWGTTIIVTAFGVFQVIKGYLFKVKQLD